MSNSHADRLAEQIKKNMANSRMAWSAQKLADGLVDELAALAKQQATGGAQISDERIINLTQQVGECGATRVHELHGETLTIFKGAELFEFARAILAEAGIKEKT